MEELSKYIRMKQDGSSPIEICRQAIADGHQGTDLFRLVREVLDISLVDAKDLISRASGLGSVEENQERLLPGLEEELGGP